MGIQVIYKIEDAEKRIPGFRVETREETTLEFDEYALDCTPIERKIRTGEVFAGEQGMGFVSSFDDTKAWFDNNHCNDELVTILERYGVPYYRV